MVESLFERTVGGWIRLSSPCGSQKLSNSNELFVERNQIKCNMVVFKMGLFFLGAFAKY